MLKFVSSAKIKKTDYKNLCLGEKRLFSCRNLTKESLFFLNRKVAILTKIKKNWINGKPRITGFKFF